MQRTALFICNANAQTGFGHLMRCLSIAQQAVDTDWQVHVAGVLSEQAAALIASTVPSAAVSQLQENDIAAQLDRLIESTEPLVVHLDTYDTSVNRLTTRQSLLSNAQDGHFGRRTADLAIDANLDAELRWESHESRAIPLLGALAMQLRQQVRRLQHRVRSTIETPLRILVVLGGTDPAGATPKLVNALCQTDIRFDLTVVCRQTLHDEVRTAFEAGPVERALALHAFVAELPELANEHDLVITAAGTSTWDFAAMGLPMALIGIVDNHSEGYQAAIAAGLALPIGDQPTPGELAKNAEAALQAALQTDVRERLSRRGKELVDGLGAWRIVRSWEQLLKYPPKSAAVDGLSCRPAQLDDARMLLDWRNDKSTRSASRSSEEIAWDDHARWLEATLANSDRQLLVIERDHSPLGTARWDRITANSWEVSITVNPAFRGQGLAGPILCAAEGALQVSAPTLLIAAIHESNPASQTLFARAAYLPYQPVDEHGFASYAKWKF